MAEEPRDRPFLRITKLVLFAVTPLVVLAVTAETCATFTISRRGSTTVDSATGRGLYTMRIGKWPWSRVSMTPLNSLGYPDDEFPRGGSKSSCTHIVIAGDSYTLGDGVDRDSNFVEVVRREAGGRAGAPCVRLFNLGVRGTTIDRQSDAILKTLERLQPDVVLLSQYQNDLTDLTNPGAILDPNREQHRLKRTADSVRVQLAIFNANIIKLLTYQSFGLMIRFGIPKDVLRRWSVLANPDRADDARRYQDTYAKLYAELVTTLRSRGIDFGAIVIPSKLDVLAKRYPEEAFFVGLAQAHDVPVLRLFPVFNEKRRPYAFLTYDGHLNEHGNRMVAAEVSRWLFEADTAPFPVLRPPVLRDRNVRRAPGPSH